jgi:hypothetical protein
VVMPARPLNIAKRHLAPKTPLHRNDPAIESQSLDLPATPNPSVYIIAVLGSTCMQEAAHRASNLPAMHVFNAPARQACLFRSPNLVFNWRFVASPSLPNYLYSRVQTVPPTVNPLVCKTKLY